MMTVKIQRNDGPHQTQLFEITNPEYQILNAFDYEGFCVLVKSYTKDYQIPNFLLIDTREPEKEFDFLVIFSLTGNTDTSKVIFARNATVYIMSEGKTIDTIYC